MIVTVPEMILGFIYIMSCKNNCVISLNHFSNNLPQLRLAAVSRPIVGSSRIKTSAFVLKTIIIALRRYPPLKHIVNLFLTSRSPKVFKAHLALLLASEKLAPLDNRYRDTDKHTPKHSYTHMTSPPRMWMYKRALKILLCIVVICIWFGSNYIYMFLRS